LKKAGVEVKSGMLSSDCFKLNTRITAAIRRKMPLVAARFAMSLDGKTATRTGHSFWISGPQARNYARKLRGSYDVLLVGAGTVLADNPLLTCRTHGMPEPLRVICDSHLRISPNAKVFTKPKIAIATSAKMDKLKAGIFHKMGVPLILCGRERVHLPTLMRKLFDLGKRSVLIEGGGEITGSAFDEGLVERIYSFIAPKIIGGEHAISPVRGIGVARADKAHQLANMRVSNLGEDIFVMADVLPAKR
jgi:diaminohydroxyphosphoribosylaminopyrimidine deaminase/5-amino-6-(5-phosphoribosylamino)uracil reductase